MFIFQVSLTTRTTASSVTTLSPRLASLQPKNCGSLLNVSLIESFLNSTDFNFSCCSLNNGGRVAHAELVQLDQAGEPRLLLQLVHTTRRGSPGTPCHAFRGAGIQ